MYASELTTLDSDAELTLIDKYYTTAGQLVGWNIVVLSIQLRLRLYCTFRIIIYLINSK